ncbi:MAG: glycosyltransferase, partial [Bacilli bacterium]
SLIDLGHSVDVYMFSGLSYKKEGINFISLNLFGMGVIADEYMISNQFGKFDDEETYKQLAIKLENLIDGDKYDIIHLNSPYFLLAWQNCKRIFTHHSNYEELKIMFSELEYEEMVKLTKEQSTNKSTKFVCPSIYYKKKWDLLSESNTMYIPHAIDPERLVIDTNKTLIYEKYGLNSKLITILLPSRLEPIQKRPKLFLEGCSLLPDELKKNIQVILTGIGEQYEQFVKELDDYSKDNKINTKFVKFDSINEGYHIANIVAVPSKSESFGYSALEGLTLGVKTILSDIPTFRELSEGNGQATFFDGTKTDLFAKLYKILYNNDIQRKLPSKKWLNQYSIELFGKRYLEVFDNEQSTLLCTYEKYGKS